ncbi:hypothetical protein KTR66_09170 [Roseococcus sp. SDR]|uniref:histidine phosphotransferase family protein n=1 Tax=Roseococcus sp. SDR TaxID=2835532 RepID=UPI001BCD7F72|nr:histidine phosphotransferase family protein [Roseococcus sp. SDR]MBS7790165.1 hypothetical protein [Roseococcus sp. SDR]MBV1845479.1 hypothetical protein [Roseococcus sp. SDR]
MLQPHRLAELMAARIFHDLGSPMASITAILPQATEPAAHAIVMETAGELRARMKLFSAAFGHGDDLGWAELAVLLRGAPMAHRVRFELPGATAPMAAGRVRLMLSLALLAAEALPRGGVVRVAEDPHGWVSVLPEGRDAAWSPTLAELVAGGALETALADGPRRVLAPWALAQAEAEGMELSFALGMGQAVPPLRVGPTG